ncbi:MAG: amino acid permease [Bacteroidetes bacterium]|nr:amino acid permease [Bacteroidota bacterium]
MPIKPQLRQFDLTMIVVGLVIGMGIFRAAPEVAAAAQVPWVFFAAWILGALVSVIGALTFAEIGSRYPAAGGFYKIFSHCYHPAMAFMVNWITVISNAASTAGVAIMGGEYIMPLIFPQAANDTTMKLITMGAVLLLFVFNFLGIRVGSRILNVLMVVKISLLVLIIAAIFIVDTPAAAAAAPRADFVWWHALALCFIPTFFTYGGYQQTMNFGGDVVNPRKTFPRSVFIAMSLVMVLYLAANYAYVHAIGFETLKSTKTLAADVMGLMFGDVAFKVVSVLMFFSVMAYVNVSLMSNPRVYFAMAEDKVLPPVFMKVNSKTQVQEFGLTLFCFFILITLFFTSSFQRILEYVMFFDSIGFITAASAIFILRYRAKKSGDPDGIFKMKGYPYLPILFVLAYATVSIVVLVAKPHVAFWGVLLFLSGLPLFYLVRFLVKRFSTNPV